MRLTHGSLPMMERLIHQNQYYYTTKKPLRQNVSVHNGCRGIDVSILYQIKKAPANAEASTTTTMIPYCGLRGGDILLFVFLVFVVLINYP